MGHGDNRGDNHEDNVGLIGREREIAELNCRTYKWEKGSHRNLKLLKFHIQYMVKYMNKWGWKFF